MTVTALHDSQVIVQTLSDAISDVLNQERFSAMSVAQVIGVLEILQWGLVSRTPDEAK